ncbi:permease [Proteiniclasticum sp. C24MP]|uniref:permease n=1 Tax=Proteiniclasticum sp. C24MP TaxID=3374101 RepID=UPI0037549565
MNAFLYGTTLVLLIISFYKDKMKTKKALRKAWKAFENILPEFLVVITLVGVLIAVLNPEVISRIIGADSGWIGVVLATLVGSVTMIPGFIAFPTAALLLEGGAGYMQIGAFISSLMMVGFITIPVEMKYFGRKTTFLRNGLAYVFSYVVALVIGWVVMSL